MSVVDELTRRILLSLPNTFSNHNHDADRFGPLSIKNRMSGLILKGTSKLGWYRLPIRTANSSYTKAAPPLKRLTEPYQQLEDQTSKDLLVMVLAYRVLAFKTQPAFGLASPGYIP